MLTQQEVESKDNSILPDEATNEETLDPDLPQPNEYGYRFRVEAGIKDPLRFSQEVIDFQVTEAKLLDDDADGVILEEGSDFEPNYHGTGSQIYVDSLLSSDRQRSDSPKLNRPAVQTHHDGTVTHNLIVTAPEADLESPGLSLKFKEFSGTSPHGFKGAEVSPISNGGNRLLPGIQNHFYSAPKPFQLPVDQNIQRGSDGFIEREIQVPFDTEEDSASSSKLPSDRSNKLAPSMGRIGGITKLTEFLKSTSDRSGTTLSRERKDRFVANQNVPVGGPVRQLKTPEIRSNNNFLRMVSPLHPRPAANTNVNVVLRQPSPNNKKPGLLAPKSRVIDQEALMRVERKNEGRRNPRHGTQAQSKLVGEILKLGNGSKPFQKKTSSSIIISSHLQSALDKANQSKSRTSSRPKDAVTNLSVGQIAKLNSKSELTPSRNNSSSSKKQLAIEGFRPSSSRGNSIGGTSKPLQGGLGSIKGSSSASALFSKFLQKSTRTGQGQSLEGKSRIPVNESETSTGSVTLEAKQRKPVVNAEFQQMLKRIHASPKPAGMHSAGTLLITNTSGSESNLMQKGAKMVSATDRKDKSPSLMKKITEMQLAKPNTLPAASKRQETSARAGSTPLAELLNIKPKPQSLQNENLQPRIPAGTLTKGPYPSEKKAPSQKKLELGINLDNVAPVLPEKTKNFASTNKLISYISQNVEGSTQRDKPELQRDRGLI